LWLIRGEAPAFAALRRGEQNPNDESHRVCIRHLGFFRHSTFVIRHLSHSSFSFVIYLDAPNFLTFDLRDRRRLIRQNSV
jgi:hypothetical protein